MDLLWPDSGGKAASGSLRKALYAARRTLDPAGGSDYLANEGGSLVLRAGGGPWVDVDAFEDAAAAARRSREPAAYRAAIELYVGELLPGDRYEGWAEGRREELRRLRFELLVELAGLYEKHGDFASAMGALREVLAGEQANEEAHVGLMRLQALSGNKAEALAQYGRLERAISTELGAEPSAQSRALRDEIAAGRFPPGEARPSEPSLEKGWSAGRHNLPAPRTSFVGREKEMIEIKRILAMTRILTLTGSGGSGKTRLALEVSRDLVGAYQDGVWLVELAPLSQGDLVPNAVADALGVKEQAARSLTESLVDALRGKDALLVVDNCEHLLGDIARLLDVLLDNCPHLRVLATSREPLGVAGEFRWMVPTLSAPGPRGSPRVQELERYESARLFLARARNRDLSFALTPGNARAVAEICRRLEGIPLAIELVAARVGTLSVEQISERLGGSISLLTRGGRTAEPRQRTLKETFDWSHDLLTEGERDLFRHISVFAGGWTLEAAEAVCRGEGIQKEDVLDLLGGLVDKSLVVTGASTGGTVRYRMLEPIRQYARQKLEESKEGENVGHRHAEFCLVLAEEATLRLNGPDRLAWTGRLQSEQANVRAALSWALEREDAELALRLAGTVDWSSFGEGSGFREWIKWLEEALAIGERAPAAARVEALCSLMWVALWQGDLVRAEAAGEVSLDLSRQSNDTKKVVFSLRLLANVAMADRGDYRRATKLFEEGVALCRERGYTGELAQYLADMGEWFMLRGDLRRAKKLLDEAATLLREEENGGGLEIVLESQGWVALLQGDHAQARAFHDEGLALCLKVDNKLFAESNLEGLACIAAARGEDERAARLFGAARALQETLGYQQSADQWALREPYLATARSRLDGTAWEAVFAEGRAMTFEEAVEYALSEEGPIRLQAPVRPKHLTPREEEVVALVAKGLTNRQIAARLVISESTVETHLARIFKKLALHSRTQLSVWVNDRGLSSSNPG